MRNKQAFTLIELLVAITIVAILAALILPAISNAKGRAYEASCVNNLKQLYMATMMYADDHDGNLPDTTWIDPPEGKSLRELLVGYIPDSDENYTCPTNPLKDVYLSGASYGHSCYQPLCERYKKWDNTIPSQTCGWDSCNSYDTIGGSLIEDFIDDSGLASHRNNKFGLHITTKGVIYFWYPGAWAEYPSGKDCVLR
jgi:prepilin-type N-terminal cleavage/methylation domain-containing protein